MGKGQAIAGFILGIVSIVFGLLSGVLSIIGLPHAIVGLVLSVIGGRKLKANGLPAGLATAGLVLGIIAVVFTAIAFFTCGICILCAAGAAGAAENAWSSFGDKFSFKKKKETPRWFGASPSKGFYGTLFSLAWTRYSALRNLFLFWHVGGSDRSRCALPSQGNRAL